MEKQNVLKYTEDEFNELTSYIEKSFGGKITNIYHEKVSEHVHIDIVEVGPSKGADYYKLVSVGAGVYEMNVPWKLKGYSLEHAELVMLLPKENKISLDNPESIWPIIKMKEIIRTPIRENSWLGYGHTFGDGEPLTKDTDMKWIGLVIACDKDCQQMIYNTGDKVINYYQMLPMHNDELRYKKKHSMDELINKLDDKDIPIMMDLKRENSCKNRFRKLNRDLLN